MASGTSTGTAVPSAATVSGIHFVVGVPLRTVGSTQLQRSDALSSVHVLGLGNGLQMAGIHARAITAEVVEHQPFGGTPVGQPIGDAMSAAGSSGTELEEAIPSLFNRRTPHKAVALGLDLRPEPLFKGLQQLWPQMGKWIAMPVPAVVVRFAPPVGLVPDRFLAIRNSARGDCTTHVDSVSHVRRVQPSP